MDDQLIKDIITAVSAVLAIISYFLKRKSDQEKKSLQEKHSILSSRFTEIRNKNRELLAENQRKTIYRDSNAN